MLGAIGVDDRINSTVIGDHVNLASRLESLTVRYQSSILVSENTLLKCGKSKHLARLVDYVKVKGKGKLLKYTKFLTMTQLKISKQNKSPLLNSILRHNFFKTKSSLKVVNALEKSLRNSL